MSIRVLHLLGTAQYEDSGIARIVASLATGLDPARYEVHAWFLGPDGPLVEDLRAAGANAISIDWWHGVRDPIGAYRFWRRLRDHQFAMVHQHFGARSIRWLIRLASDARLVVHLHGRISGSGSDRNVPIAVRGADLVIAASRAVAAQLPTLKPIVIHAGIPLPEQFRVDRTTRPTPTIIGTACRLVPLKGLLDLIRAMALLHSEFPELRLEIAGSGPQLEGLQGETDHLGLTNQVRFLGWERDLLPCFRRWSIFAVPSLEEGFCMAALEAMAAGLPVVATSVGGLPELVEDCRTGYLVPPSDVAALAARLRLLIVDPKRQAAMGAAGRERARDYFSVDRMVAETAAVYESILRRRPARAH